MDRRTFLLRTFETAGGALLSRSVPAPAVPAEGAPLRELPEVRSTGGVLDYHLDVAMSEIQLGERTLAVDAYNGGVPGPVLRVRTGDTMRILLHNHRGPVGIPRNVLPPSSASRVPNTAGFLLDGHTLPQTVIATNLHTHGLQVSPEGSADNMFVRVNPVGSHQYSYDIPADQPAGMCWYYPHFHGSARPQEWAGLAGPLIVVGDLDEIPEITDMRERVLVANEPCGGDSEAVPINGQLTPEITIRPGEPQRWRLLNAAPYRALWLHIDGHELHQIGQDGIPFAAPRRRPHLMLVPGNRAEFIVRGGRPGRFRIYARSYGYGQRGGTPPTVPLATLVVSGAPVTGRVPTRLVEPPRMPDLPVARRRILTFASGHGRPALINGMEYDLDRIDQQVRAGTVEDWTLVNHDVVQHSFHMHVNPFHVIDVRGIPRGDTSWWPRPDGWWDVFRMPSQGQVTIRVYFRPDATGKTVYHCRIFPHEDNEMMGNVLIQE